MHQVNRSFASATCNSSCTPRIKQETSDSHPICYYPASWSPRIAKDPRNADDIGCLRLPMCHMPKEEYCNARENADVDRRKWLLEVHMRHKPQGGTYPLSMRQIWLVVIIARGTAGSSQSDRGIWWPTYPSLPPRPGHSRQSPSLRLVLLPHPHRLPPHLPLPHLYLCNRR